MPNEETLALLRVHDDPLVRVAVEKLEAIAGADYRGNRPPEQVEAYNALEELARTAERQAAAVEERRRKLMALKEVKPDYGKPWVVGLSHVVQEGSKLEMMRRAYGLDREEIEALSGGRLPVPLQELYENYPGLPNVYELAEYAAIFSARELVAGLPPGPDGAAPFIDGWSVGGLLDYLLWLDGHTLIEGEVRAKEAGRAAAKKLYDLAVGASGPGDGPLTEREMRDARGYIDEYRLRLPGDRKLTLDGRPVPDHWDNDGLDHAARTAAFVTGGA